MNWIKKKWNSTKADVKTVKQFGLILSLILFILGGLALWRGHHQYKFEWPLAVIVLAISLIIPRFLVFIYQPWMIVAETISWVVLRVILGILFYLILSPVNLIMILFKKDILDQRLDPSASTYWKKRTGFSTKERYEKLF